MKKVLASLAFIVMIVLCVYLSAQTPPPELDAATNQEIQTILQTDRSIQGQIDRLTGQKYANLQKLHEIKKKVDAQHPGFHLDEQTGSLFPNPH
jgi:peptidoglycan hydrolase CwlO-like protein